MYHPSCEGLVSRVNLAMYYLLLIFHLDAHITVYTSYIIPFKMIRSQQKPGYVSTNMEDKTPKYTISYNQLNRCDSIYQTTINLCN